jgi:hypothetical protein
MYFSTSNQVFVKDFSLRALIQHPDVLKTSPGRFSVSEIDRWRSLIRAAGIALD